MIDCKEKQPQSSKAIPSFLELIRKGTKMDPFSSTHDVACSSVSAWGAIVAGLKKKCGGPEAFYYVNGFTHITATPTARA